MALWICYFCHRWGVLFVFLVTKINSFKPNCDFKKILKCICISNRYVFCGPIWTGVLPLRKQILEDEVHRLVWVWIQVWVPHQREMVKPWHYDESDYPLWLRAQVAATLLRESSGLVWGAYFWVPWSTYRKFTSLGWAFFLIEELIYNVNFCCIVKYFSYMYMFFFIFFFFFFFIFLFIMICHRMGISVWIQTKVKKFVVSLSLPCLWEAVCLPMSEENY